MAPWHGRAWDGWSAAQRRRARARDSKVRRTPRADWRTASSRRAPTHHGDARFAAGTYRFDEVRARVPLLQPREDGVVHGFDGARYEGASRFLEPREHVAMTKQVLHLDRDVVADRRIRRVQRLDDSHRM